MIKIQIGNSGERDLDEAGELWITQQINRRRQEGLSACVRVTIHIDDVNMALATPSCAGVGGGGRYPNTREQRIFDLWAERGLSGTDFAPGNLIAFLKQLDRLI